jgi:selenocysteine lyase/cysteine desulfurase
VHGFGNAEDRVEDLGCDVFIAGCHKWLFGPRGTGIVWGRPAAWRALATPIPPLEMGPMKAWIKGEPPPYDREPAVMATPGGFHAFEHRWALPAAFALHERFGRARIAERTHALNTQAKEGLAAMAHVTLHTPASPALSAGIVAFEVAGVKPEEVVKRLLARRIVATSSPYAVSYARITPAAFNSPEDVDTALREIRALA